MPNYAACPANAPPGSVWTIIRGHFGCRAPDGTEVPVLGPNGVPLTPVPGTQPKFGQGPLAPNTGTPLAPRSTLQFPPNYGPQPGGGSGAPGGAGGSSPWKYIIPGAAGILSSFFDYLGKKNTNNAQNQNNAAATAQQRADTEARAHAAAAIYSKMLQGYGHGDLANEDQLYNALLKEPTPTVKIAGPSVFTGLSGLAGDAAAGAQDYYYRQQPQQPQGQQQNDILSQIMELLKKNQGSTPVQGGTTIPNDWMD